MKQAPHRLALLLALALPLTLTLTACDTNQEDPTVTGAWTSTTTVSGQVFALNLQLTERDQVITGNGTLSFGGTFAVNVSGNHTFPAVSLTISDAGGALNFSGTLSDDARLMTGTLSGGGVLENFAVTLRRQ